MRLRADGYQGSGVCAKERSEWRRNEVGNCDQTLGLKVKEYFELNT